jgi:hypothetical protein
MLIKENTKEMKGKLSITKRDIDNGWVKEIGYYNNVICTVSKTMIADNLTNSSPDNVMRINYFAVGSGVTAVGAGDSTLETETYRNLVASETNASNIVYITGFLSATEDSGTYGEAGLFSNGTGSADSGILVSHVNITETKSGTETLTIDWQITIN